MKKYIEIDSAINVLNHRGGCRGDVLLALHDLPCIKSESDITHLAELAKASDDGRAVILPCKRGDKLYRITDQYRVGLRVTEYYVRGFHKIGKGKDISVEVSVNGSRLTNIMKYKNFYTSREEAESALAEKGKADV